MKDITAKDLLSKRLFGYLRWRLHRGAEHESSVLSALQADLAQTRPDQIVVTGDLTHLSLSVEFKKASRWLRSLGPPSKVTVVPGNHDAYVKTDWRQTMALWTDYMRSDPVREGDRRADRLDRLFPSFRLRDPVAIIGVCTARPTAAHLAVGSIGTPQLQNLKNMLCSSIRQQFFRVLLIHHPPISDAVSRRKRLTDAAALQSLIARCGAELILHGHAHRVHQGYLKTSGGRVPVMGVPSISALGRTFERRARYYIYRITPGFDRWTVRLEVRIYSSSQNQFITEREQQL
jgi:3',5'-cyclic AMP phosphodiesterase CpdA